MLLNLNKNQARHPALDAGSLAATSKPATQYAQFDRRSRLGGRDDGVFLPLKQPH